MLFAVFAVVVSIGCGKSQTNESAGPVLTIVTHRAFELQSGHNNSLSTKPFDLIIRTYEK